jgi:ribosomal protein S18 acetylase RimI-like enzyme
MSVNIRLAREEDVPVLEELYFQFTNWLLPRSEALRKAVKDPNCELLVAETNGQVVGFTHQIFFFDIVHAGLLSYITSLFVKEEHREKGIASKLIQAVLTSAKSRRVVEIHLDTKEYNEDAMRLYEKLGFKRVGITFERNP